MATYYNEIDQYCVQWLRNLIAAGHLPAGDVDERDIRDVAADDLAGYHQCHFFAGIGGWALALRLAGVPDDANVWTGSCPCQPFSTAGKRREDADERHLWPEFYRLIAERRPAIVFGEQVASSSGRSWLSTVFADLETVGYAVAGADLCAAGVGAPHIRQRLYWVGHTDGAGWPKRRRDRPPAEFDRSSQALRVADTDLCGCERARVPEERVGDDNTRHDRVDWRRFVPWQCTDGRSRPVEPGIHPLAHGILGRVAVVRTDEQTGSPVSHWYNRAGAIKGFGNAIVPQLAAEFVGAFFWECQP